jgi:hypothetical protein
MSESWNKQAAEILIDPNALKSIQRDAEAQGIDFRNPSYQFTLWGVDPGRMVFLGSYRTLEGVFQTAAAESVHCPVHVVEAVVHSNGMLNLRVIQR